jgi:hypothetical protein
VRVVWVPGAQTAVFVAAVAGGCTKTHPATHMLPQHAWRSCLLLLRMV